MLNEVEMLKKYFYVSILLGAFALSGCTDDEVDTKEVTEESSLAEQSKANNNEVNTTKTKEAAPIPLNLTQEQKEEYYQKYVAIIEKVNAISEEDFTLELEPITALINEHWIKVEEFEKLAKERANASIIVLENNERYNPMSVPKTVKLQIGSKEANIIFEGSFDTQLNENTSKGRQLFSVFNGISSEVLDTSGSWIQLGYDESLSDGDTVYKIVVGGKYSQSGIISSHNIEMEFHCNENGGIS
jgi:PBP1b-binding outer membrane lipoprotein LpoB